MFSNKCLLLSSMCCKFSLLLALRDTTNVTFVQEFLEQEWHMSYSSSVQKLENKLLRFHAASFIRKSYSLSLTHMISIASRKWRINKHSLLWRCCQETSEFGKRLKVPSPFVRKKCTLISPSSCTFPDCSKLRQVIKRWIVPSHRTVNKNTCVSLPVRAYWGFAKRQHPRKETEINWTMKMFKRQRE